MRVLALSGWSQAVDGLRSVLPKGAMVFDYGAYSTIQECFRALQYLLEAPDTVVGWSLGGQVAVRAIAAGVLSPEKLVLIASPFQCAASEDFPDATPVEILAKSRAYFIEYPPTMLREFMGFVSLGHHNQREVYMQLLSNVALQENHHWLYWFDELVRFSCREVDFSGFPLTELIWGEGDRVIPSAQAHHFLEALPGSRLHLLPECGHAPQWHDANFIRRVITGEI